MKKFIILMLVFGSIFTLSGCVSAQDISNVENDLVTTTDSISTANEVLADLKTELATVVADLENAYSAYTANTTLIAMLEEQVVELNRKIATVEGTMEGITYFSDGAYFPGVYHGNSFDSVILDEETYNVNYSSSVVVDRNGKIAGSHNDVILPYSVDDKTNSHYTLNGGYFKFPNLSVADLAVVWNDLDGSETLTAGDELTFIDGYMWSFWDKIMPGTTITMVTDTTAGNIMNPFEELSLNLDPVYSQIYFSVSASSYDQQLEILTNMNDLFENRVSDLETATTGIIDKKIVKNDTYYTDNVVPKLDDISNIEIDIDTAIQNLVDTYGVTVSINDEERVAHNTVYNINAVSDRTALDTATLTVSANISDKKLELSNAVDTYNVNYLTSYVVDTNGHIDVLAITADKDLLDPIADALQIADIDALLALDAELINFETEASVYSDFEALLVSLNTAENALTRNYGPLWYVNKYNNELVAFQDELILDKAKLTQYTDRITKLVEIKPVLDGLAASANFDNAIETAIADEKLPEGIKLALNDNVGDYNSGTFVTALSQEYSALSSHREYSVFKDENGSSSYIYYTTATAMLGVVVDEYGNIAGSFTNTLGLEEVELTEATKNVTSLFTFNATETYYYDATSLITEYADVYDESLLDEEGNYTSNNYEIVSKKNSNTNYMGETGAYKEYVSYSGYVKIGDDYVSKNSKYLKTSTGYQYYTWSDDGTGTKTWIMSTDFEFVVANEKNVVETLLVVDELLCDSYNNYYNFNDALINGANFASNDKTSWSLYYEFILPLITE